MARTSPTRPRSRRRFVLALTLLRVAGGVALSEMLGWPFLRAGGLWIAAADGFDVPHMLDADNVRLRLRYRDLWALREQAPSRIAALDVERIDARLIRRDDGEVTARRRTARGRAAPEPGPIAARVLGGIVLAFINPLAAIIPFIDPGTPPEPLCSRALEALRG